EARRLAGASVELRDSFYDIVHGRKRRIDDEIVIEQIIDIDIIIFLESDDFTLAAGQYRQCRISDGAIVFVGALRSQDTPGGGSIRYVQIDFQRVGDEMPG